MASISAPDGTTIEFDDYEAIGGDADATPVILVHGITESAATWEPLIEPLRSARRVVAMDLRGHGRSGTADRYDLEAMVGDVVAVAMSLGLERPHLVGHSLGGAVVSAAGAAFPVSSVVSVDQSLQLDGFKEQLMGFEAQLRDPDAFPLVIQALFELMAGDKIDADEMARVNAARRPDQSVVLGVWEMILTTSTEEIAAVVDAALAGYAGVDVPVLSLFGIDPGPGYADWVASYVSGATTEVWPDQGHYPHLVDPVRFIDRLTTFWS
ncbi:MAG: alpha/beta fold hydrolase [Ilumatobacter sp.]